MEHYDSALAYPVQFPGDMGNQPDIIMDSLAVHGLVLVHSKKFFNFYNQLYGYLASCGVDGVKVDVQNIIETVGSGHGGRVALTHSYQQTLEASVTRNFPDNGCISFMCHNTDGMYSSKQIAVVRASDDFYPRDPASHTIDRLQWSEPLMTFTLETLLLTQFISPLWLTGLRAYYSLFLGEFMQPDWDMFHFKHGCQDVIPYVVRSFVIEFTRDYFIADNKVLPPKAVELSFEGKSHVSKARVAKFWTAREALAYTTGLGSKKIVLE